MNCRRCQSQVVESAHFCHVCGFMLKPFCSTCRLSLPLNAQFCFHCGQPIATRNIEDQRSTQTTPSTTLNLSPSLTPQPTQVNSPSPRNITIPEGLRKKFESAQAAIEGERKLVSILFADISGFTAMSEKMDPEKVTEIINLCFKRLGTLVYDFEGYIDKFMGDCIMALFGAPLAHENDPELAIKCSLAMLNELEKINKETGFNLKMSIGINSGMVVAGGMGTTEQLNYTVIGDAVNLAQRLQSAANPQQILVSKTIYKSCEKSFDFEILPPIKVKGKENQVEVFSVVRSKRIQPKDKSLQRGYGALVGREKEINLAEKLLEDLIHSQGQLFCVSGEAGIGKTRFKHEIKKSVLRKKFTWVEASCQALATETPYFVFQKLLQSIFEIDLDSTQESREEKKKLLELYQFDRISVALICELIGIPSPEPLEAIDPAQRKRLLTLSIKKLLIQLSQKNPTVIHLDDLQWVDPLSRDVLDSIIDSVPKHPLMIYTSFRNDFQHDWHQKKNFTHISLAPMPLDKTLELVKAILTIEEIPVSLSHYMTSRAEGNPLYIEEIIKILIDSGVILKTATGWHVTEEIKVVDIPPTLQALVASRIDKLYHTDKQVLQYASVIGRQFNDALLSKASGMNEQLYTSLKFLRKKELIYELSSDAEGIVYIFNQTLTQEVAYQSILLKKRKLYHQSVAQAIEALYPHQLEDHLETLAHHYHESDNEPKAIDYLHKAGQKLALNYNNNGAIQLYQKAIALLEKKEKPGENLQNIYLDISEVFVLIGDYKSAEEYQQKILNLVNPEKDFALLSRVYRRLGDIARMRGQFEEALKFLNRSLEEAEKGQDFENKCRTYKAMANTMKFSNKLDKALEFFHQGLEGAERLEDRKLVSEFLNDIATVYIVKNNLEAAQQKLEESIRISKTETKLKPLYARSVMNLGVVQFLRNDFEKALLTFKESAQTSHQIGDLLNVMNCRHNIGEVLIRNENYVEALKEFEQSLALAEEMESAWDQVNNRIFIGHLKSKLKRPEEAEKILTDCIASSEKNNYDNFYCEAHLYLGKHYVGQDKKEEAITSFQKALEKAKQLKLQSIQDQCEEELKRLPGC